MEKTPFRYRGVVTVVDTTDAAEFDVAGYHVSEAIMSKIGKNLATVPFSDRDRIVKAFRVRELFSYDVVFMLMREKDHLVANIVAIRPFDPEVGVAGRLRVLTTVATLRSATGV